MPHRAPQSVRAPCSLRLASALLLAALAAWFCTSRAYAEPLRRTAVIVGSNAAAPGRKPLRYSEHDARAFAAVLIELGGFAPDDVHVLIEPEPSLELNTLDHALARPGADESLLVFYYSGHADASALYPRGRPLSFAELRTRLGDRRAAIRLGIIDACRGGGFTGAKGLTEVAPFEVTLPMALESEGSILIASSSGLEDAHESELLGGSFFTHHWNAGLRGAGDHNGDGQVTLAEAFDYAKTLTIRDSALETPSAQHPSFSLNLRGRQDLSLSKLASADAIVAVEQREGPLELIHLGSGVVVLELPKGRRQMRLAVAPGDYLLRRRQGSEVWTRELAVSAGSTTRVDEAALELHGSGALAIKRSAARPITLSTLPRGKQEATFWLGVSYEDRTGVSRVSGVDRGFQAGAMVPRGLTDRWQWVLPTLAFAYRGGEHGAFEWIPMGGLLGWGAGFSTLEGFVLDYHVGADISLRKWLSPRTALTLGLGLNSHGRWITRPGNTLQAQQPDGELHGSVWGSTAPTTWRGFLSTGVMHTLGDTVTLGLALNLTENVIYRGEIGPYAAHSKSADLRLGLGAVQSVGLRPMHLIQVHVSDWMAINLDASLQYRFETRKVHESYLLGASFLW
jgi:hypothetical protein